MPLHVLMKRIVFLGDSFFEGWGVPRELSMPSLIQRKLDAAGLDFQVVNAGVSGDTSSGGLTRIVRHLEEPLDFLIVEFGTNDVLYSFSNEKIKNNLIEIIRLARRTQPNISVLLFQLRTLPGLPVSSIKDYEGIFPNVAESENVPLLPFFLDGVLGNRKLNQPDGVHPNEAGTEAMANNVWKAILPYLQNNN